MLQSIHNKRYLTKNITYRYESSVVRQKEIAFLLKMLPSFGKKEKFIMDTWKSGVGIVKKESTKTAPRRPKAKPRVAPRVKKRVPPSVKKEPTIEEQIEVLDRKMRECANAMDFRGASNYQKQIKALQSKLESAKKDRAKDEKIGLLKDVRRRTPGLMDSIKGAMRPLIQAKRFKECIPLREEMIAVEKTASKMESQSSEAEWRETYKNFQNIAEKY